MLTRRLDTTVIALLLGAAALIVPRAALADFAGGSAKAGCYAVLKGITATKGKNIDCQDGAACDADGEVNDSCTFQPQVCINSPDFPPCTPTDVTAFPKNTANLPLPAPSATQNDCAEPGSVVVPVKVKSNGKKKTGKLKVQLFADSSGKPKRDKNKFALRCLPGTGGGNGGAAFCPANGDPAANNPNQIVTKMLPTGSDLDNGWTGTSFNFPVIQDVEVTACLSNCDKTTDPICDLTGPTGEGSLNSPTLGPPLPLVAGGVAVCVVNRFQQDFTGTVNLQTGESTIDIKLFSDVHITDRTFVCPRCENGTCDRGPNRGRPCTVHGKTFVEETFASNKTFQLSRDCPPEPNQLLSTLNIQLAPTTGTARTPGKAAGVTECTGNLCSKPCTENQAAGVPPQDDNCGGSRCSTAPNCSGSACVSTVADPSNPGATICVDRKGGLSQLCCNGTPSVPCHPTFPQQGAIAAGPGIIRTGRPVAAATPTPWGDDQYPKTASGVVLVSTFCEAATGDGTVDITTGLPGPGALIFNTDATVSINPPPAQ